MDEDLSDTDVTEIVTQTLKYADQDGDNMLNMTEFKDFYNQVFQITI